MTTLTEKKPPVRRKVHAHSPHGISDTIVVSLFPNGTIGLRELGRALHTEQTIEVASLYVELVERSIRRADRLKKQYVKDGLTRSQAGRKARKECGL